MLSKPRFVFLLACVFVLARSLFAGGEEVRTTATPAVAVPSEDDRFLGGHVDLSLMTGLMYSPFRTDFLPRTSTSFDYTQTELRLGIMFNSPWEAGILRGNVEGLIGLGGGVIFEGPGNALANGDLFLRYNFVQRNARIVPYFQLGLGLVYTDAAQDHSQRVIGRDLEFCLQGGPGCRFLINSRWSLDLEALFQHISNANTADRNVGVNALGGMIGLTRSF